MSVYLDNLTPMGTRRWCHMIADTLAELHELADKIGMQRRWFQPSPPASFPHYDLRPTKRALAVRAGAVECDRRTFVEHMRSVRARADDALIVSSPSEVDRRALEGYERHRAELFDPELDDVPTIWPTGAK